MASEGVRSHQLIGQVYEFWIASGFVVQKVGRFMFAVKWQFIHQPPSHCLENRPMCSSARAVFKIVSAPIRKFGNAPFNVR